MIKSVASPDLRPIVICGLRRNDKYTMYQNLVEFHEDKFTRPPNHTTRWPAPWEIDAGSEIFVCRGDFLNLLHGDRFFHWQYFEGNHYGTSMDTVASLQKQGMVSIFETDLTGHSLTTKYQCLNPRYVFIRPPNAEYLRSSPVTRGMDEDSLQYVISYTEKDLDTTEESGIFDLVIINDDPDKAFQKLEAFALGL
ncbi:hypothetical protein FPOA_08898 [Fusarium poae]|uniref:Guanylate kinase-like domain-containing protein n=1 Tax=Fusarium poae TaxID=36050 RepID=A0A1B8AQA0_FUSPO|nr:hypothetical protein FPOA_08898 [Fusarium poae]